MKKIILSVAVLAVFFTGCKKKEDDPAPSTPSSKSKTELLTANTWIQTGATASKSVDYDGDGNSSLDVFTQMDACEKDDFINFNNTNNTKSGTINEGANSCDADPNDVNAFTWALNSTESILTLAASGFSVDMTLVEVTGTTLKLSYETEDDNGLEYIQTDTYSKK